MLKTKGKSVFLGEEGRPPGHRRVNEAIPSLLPPLSLPSSLSSPSLSFAPFLLSSLFLSVCLCLCVFLILVHSWSFSLLLSPSHPVSVCLSQCIFRIPDPHTHLPPTRFPEPASVWDPWGYAGAPSTIGEGTHVTDLSFLKMKDRKSPLEKPFSIRPGSSRHC